MGILSFFKKRKTPKQKFDYQTDAIMGSACMRYGSFDNIPEDSLNNIYRKMDNIAKNVGYDGFDISIYVKNE